jgi:hypothetical protein
VINNPGVSNVAQSLVQIQTLLGGGLGSNVQQSLSLSQFAGPFAGQFGSAPQHQNPAGNNNADLMSFILMLLMFLLQQCGCDSHQHGQAAASPLSALKNQNLSLASASVGGNNLQALVSDHSLANLLKI